MKLTLRRRHIISGLAALVLVTAVATVGVKWSFGAFADGYRLEIDVAAAGQGLIKGSDVKIRGLDIGHVERIALHDGRARITLFIDGDRPIPSRSSTFTIRPKTLFGEKFVDVEPGPDETDGPYFDDGDEVPRFFAEGDPMPDDVLRDDQGRAMRSAGGFEIERVLQDVYPILQALEPNDVMTILDQLSTASRGMGPTINRSIVNGERVLDVAAAHDAETRQFIEDLAALTGELADRAPDVVQGATDLNAALPVLNDNEAAFTELLQQLGRTSGDVADLLEANTDFIASVYTDGQAVLDVLYDHRSQVVPLVVGMRQYLETVGGAARIPLGDGTVMAAVKGILGGQACSLVVCPNGGEAPPPPELPTLPTLPLPSGDTGVALPSMPLPTLPALPSAADLDQAVDGVLGDFDGNGRSGTGGVVDILLGGLVGTG